MDHAPVEYSYGDEEYPGPGRAALMWIKGFTDQFRGMGDKGG
jgi:hypothetical protein